MTPGNPITTAVLCGLALSAGLFLLWLLPTVLWRRSTQARFMAGVVGGMLLRMAALGLGVVGAVLVLRVPLVPFIATLATGTALVTVVEVWFTVRVARSARPRAL